MCSRFWELVQRANRKPTMLEISRFYWVMDNHQREAFFLKVGSVLWMFERETKRKANVLGRSLHLNTYSHGALKRGEGTPTEQGCPGVAGPFMRWEIWP